MLQTKGSEHLNQMTVSTNNKNSTVLMVFLGIEDKWQCPNVWHFPAA